ncbi:MAG: transketolase [Candidatus Magasanikbacteria bacterium]
MSVHQEKIKELEKKANDIREDIVKMLVEAGSGHSAGPLGMADVFTALYFHVLEHDPDNSMWEERDRLILSNGHIVPVRYATMAHAGYFDRKKLSSLRELESELEGHPNVNRMPALETSSGPLGEGLSQACGMAKGAKMDGKQWDYHIYCIMSDGEQQEGMTWEAAMFAGKERLENLTGIIDRNNIQIDGYTEDVMPLEPLKEKYESFGWHVLEMNGHEMSDIINKLEGAQSIQEKPVLIIANTTPGKSVDFIENRFGWHGAPPGGGPEEEVPTEKQKEEALKQLRTLGGRIESEYD